MACGRSPLLTYLVGLGYSERLTLIVTDSRIDKLGSLTMHTDNYLAELVNGYEYTDSEVSAIEGNWILGQYLSYTQVCLPLYALCPTTQVILTIRGSWR